ncbi:hypothetical protein BJ166DRAFT_606907 [Pestalotiopsis sp. NC0098]|nr:hypothetical protein BJ166DRAFT_606907 [Pestalotiopsis sp. NC0098]
MAESFVCFAERIGLGGTDLKILQVQFDSHNISESSPTDARLKLACQAAQLALGSDQVQISPMSQSSINGNWSMACVAEPYCILLPRNASDISKILRIFEYLKIRFAVRSEGHAPNPGWSSVDSSGILVSLERLNQVTLSDDKSTASLGPGGRWGDVNATLSSSRIAVLGGRASNVGVGGLLLGDGNITNANADENSDLFWALKGGGPNFGIVTRYDLYTYPLSATWMQIGLYSLDQAEQALEAFAAWQNDGGNDPNANVDAKLYKDVYRFWQERALEVRKTTGASQTFVLQNVPKSLVAQGHAKGGNPLNIPDFTHQWWTTLVDWTNAEDDDLVRSVAIDTTEKWKELSSERGLDVEFLYMNDASRDQNPIATYGIDNVKKLKSIAQKYNKSGLFQTQQNGGFLLSKVE